MKRLPVGTTQKMSAPVVFRDVSLFCVWAAASPQSTGGPPPPPLHATPVVANVELRASPVPLAHWMAVRVVVIPLRDRGPFTLDELAKLSAMLLAAARSVVPEGNPAYYVLHVGEARPQETPARPRRPARHGRHRDLVRQPTLSGHELNALMNALKAVRESAGLLTPSAPETGEVPWAGPAYFELYSQQRQQRGYLILDPRISFVIEGAEDDVRLLLTIAQQATITANGLSPASYGPLLGRVTAWVANADTQAALDSLGALDRAERSATASGVLLSLALTGFSTLLALTQLQTVNPRLLIVPTSLYAAAALLYALYTITRWRWLNALGLMCLVIATVLSGLILVAPDMVKRFVPTLS